MKCSIGLVFATALLVVGCRRGGVEEEAPRPVAAPLAAVEPAEPGGAGAAFPADQATAHITGRVLFDGDPPPRAEISPDVIAASRDEFCVKHHGSEPLLSEELVVHEDRSIRDVLVYVKSFPQPWEHEPPETAVRITQIHCVFVPHVAAVMTGQPLIVTSDDDTAHNVHYQGRLNRVRRGNVTIAKGEELEWTFRRPEVGTSYIKCDIHPWMRCYICVLDHPFFAVTGDDGSFSLGQLPPGEYEIEAWHATLGTQQQELTIADGETAAVDFTFGPK